MVTIHSVHNNTLRDVQLTYDVKGKTKCTFSIMDFYAVFKYNHYNQISFTGDICISNISVYS